MDFSQSLLLLDGISHCHPQVFRILTLALGWVFLLKKDLPDLFRCVWDMGKCYPNPKWSRIQFNSIHITVKRVKARVELLGLSVQQLVLFESSIPDKRHSIAECHPNESQKSSWRTRLPFLRWKSFHGWLLDVKNACETEPWKSHEIVGRVARQRKAAGNCSWPKRKTRLASDLQQVNMLVFQGGVRLVFWWSMEASMEIF